MKHIVDAWCHKCGRFKSRMEIIEFEDREIPLCWECRLFLRQWLGVK